VGKASAQRWENLPQVLDEKRGVRVSARPQARPEQQARARFKPAERMVHMLVVPSAEGRQLLVSMCRVVGAVDVQHQISRMFVGSVGIATEPVCTHVHEAVNGRPREIVLQQRERRL
jgi:hypothetical protein